MQIYKNRFRRATFVSFGFALVLSAVCALPLKAQTLSPEAPVPPSVTPPYIEGTSVPQLTPSSDMHKVPQPPVSPSKLQTFQNPEAPVPPAMPPVFQPPAVQKSANAKNINTTSTAAESKAMSPKNALSASDINTLSSLLGSQNPFSIQALAASGILPGADLGSASTRNTAGFYGQNDTAVLLQAIIEKLDAMQKKLENQNHKHTGTDSAAANHGNAKTAESTSKTIQKNGTFQNGRILRFIAGSYNILPSCTAVFISQPEADGSFLLTGDRRYRASDTIYGETFYMLFKAAENGTFNVAFSLSQHTENPQSLLYALTQAPVLQAVRTGNLVTMRTVTKNTRIDLLLDIDFDAREKSR